MKKTIIFLADRWAGAVGDIHIINREIATALAAVRADMRCIVLTPKATSGEISDAFSRGVELISGENGDWISALLSKKLALIDKYSLIAIVANSSLPGN